MYEELTIGTRWRHHNGTYYTILFLANIAHKCSKYPASVVYVGVSGNIYVKTVENFMEAMSPCGY
ncbi:hypothetical protein LCGC14_1388720 [marine sediment metagenome]|uniref:DUF1653 domain-containing protein n=1 Tax=marine sediment metagenome TaxID=412755 RepID=A0A0F9K0R1_9ZZZZ